jgi:hypothetical protein
MKFERRAFAVEYRYAKDVRREQIARELNALEVQAHRPGQRMGKRGFADTGQVFNQQVSSRQKTGDGQANLMFFAEDDPAYLRYDGGKRIGHSISGNVEGNQGRRMKGMKTGALPVASLHQGR